MRFWGISFRVWQILVAVAVIVVILGTGISIAVLLSTVFARESPAVRLTVSLSVAQLGAAILALVLVFLFGLYAVQQVELAREASEREGKSRHEAQRTDLLRTLGPPLLELHRNRMVAFGREWRLHVRGTPPNTFRLPFERRVYDSILAGPAWTTRDAADIWSVVEAAYSDMALLDLTMQPFLPAWAYPAVTIGSTAGTKWKPTVKWYLRLGLLGMGTNAAEILVRAWLAKQNGQATRTRVKIETAMEGIYPLLTDKPLDWNEWNRFYPPVITVDRG